MALVTGASRGYGRLGFCKGQRSSGTGVSLNVEGSEMGVKIDGSWVPAGAVLGFSNPKKGALQKKLRRCLTTC